MVYLTMTTFGMCSVFHELYELVLNNYLNARQILNHRYHFFNKWYICEYSYQKESFQMINFKFICLCFFSKIEQIFMTLF